ncbi:hypothetical protein SGLAM104S_08319 [Streptomyces glaucescens]
MCADLEPDVCGSTLLREVEGEVHEGATHPFASPLGRHLDIGYGETTVPRTEGGLDEPAQVLPVEGDHCPDQAGITAVTLTVLVLARVLVVVIVIVIGEDLVDRRIHRPLTDPEPLARCGHFEHGIRRERTVEPCQGLAVAGPRQPVDDVPDDAEFARVLCGFLHATSVRPPGPHQPAAAFTRRLPARVRARLAREREQSVALDAQASGRVDRPAHPEPVQQSKRDHHHERCEPLGCPPAPTTREPTRAGRVATEAAARSCRAIRPASAASALCRCSRRCRAGNSPTNERSTRCRHTPPRRRAREPTSTSRTPERERPARVPPSSIRASPVPPSLADPAAQPSNRTPWLMSTRTQDGGGAGRRRWRSTHRRDLETAPCSAASPTAWCPPSAGCR